MYASSITTNQSIFPKRKNTTLSLEIYVVLQKHTSLLLSQKYLFFWHSNYIFFITTSLLFLAKKKIAYLMRKNRAFYAKKIAQTKCKAKLSSMEEFCRTSVYVVNLCDFSLKCPLTELDELWFFFQKIILTYCFCIVQMQICACSLNQLL